MHTPECIDADERDWWPVGEVQDVALSTLPAAGATTSAFRFPDDERGAPWLGIWGPFYGLRVARSPRNSYPIGSGSAIVCPRKDLFLSVETLFSGKASMARFRTREAALAWGQVNNEILRAGGVLGPFPAASALISNDANPTTTRIGANLLIWDKVKLSWARAQNVANSGAPNAGGRLTTQDGWLDQSQALSNVSTASTGVKSSYTCPAGRIAYCPLISWFNRSGTAAVTMQIELVRGSTVQLIRKASGAAVGSEIASELQATLAAGDVIEWNCLASVAASTADFYIGIQERDVETP